MGQRPANPTTTPAAPNTAAIGAVKINLSDLHSTTRFDDCIDDVRHQFEAADKMIRAQEDFCSAIQAFLGERHEADLGTLGPSLDLVKGKAEIVEGTLVQDAREVEAARALGERERGEVEMCRRVVEGLRLPGGYTAGGQGVGRGGAYDTALIPSFFVPLARELAETLGAYEAQVEAVEAHLRVLEGSVVERSRVRGASGREGQAEGDVVGDLAETLRGFEGSILGVAGVVGGVRKAVEGLVLGRVGWVRGGRHGEKGA